MIYIPMEVFSALLFALTMAVAMGLVGKVITHKKQGSIDSSRTRHANYSVMVKPTDLFDEEISKKRKESRSNT